MDRNLLVFIVLLALAGTGFWLWQTRQTRHRRARYAHYARRNSLLLPHERTCYEIVQRAAGDSVRVMAKVRLGDLVTAEGESQSPQRQAHWRSAQRRSVDLLLCAADDYAPLLAIQVEGKKDRARRHARGDAILEDVLSSADIRLVVFDPSEHPDPAQLEIRVRAALEAARARVSESPLVEPQSEPPGLLRRLLGGVHGRRAGLAAPAV